MQGIGIFFTHSPNILRKVLDIAAATWYKGYVEWLRDNSCIINITLIQEKEKKEHIAKLVVDKYLCVWYYINMMRKGLLERELGLRATACPTTKKVLLRMC